MTEKGDERGVGRAPLGQSPLMTACVRGALDMIVSLLVSGEEIDWVNSEFETALTYAVVWNQIDAVELLLQRGADPEVPAKPHWSPLMYAANEGSRASVETLLKHGADRERRDAHGRSASDIARDRGFHAVARLISA
jgi:ankyrin repeat protein